jgi:hypothetical protein
MRIWLLILLLATGLTPLVQAAQATQAQKDEIEFLRCPDSYKGEAFNGFDIFGGSPDARDYLVADEDGWDIEHTRSPGDKIYLACKFGKADTEQLIEIPPNIDFCKPAGDNVDCR